MKILHVTPFYEPAWAYGGMARASAELCRALAARGHELTVLTAQLDPAHASDERIGTVRVRRFPGPRVLRDRLVPFGRGLATFLRPLASGFDLAHFHGHRSGIAASARRTLAAARVPWVLAPAGTFPHHQQWRVLKSLFDRLAGDAVVAGASALIAVSRAEAADLPRPAVVVPNGVRACGTPGPAPPLGVPRLLFVGSDRFQKRGHVLPALLDAVPEAHLELAGRFGGAFLSRFRRLGPRVCTLGVLDGDALASAYARADLVVHPAVGEAFGLVPFEAALLGTAAVVADDHGCGEWFAAAGGCVVAPDDPKALAAAVRARIGDRGRRRAEAEAVAAFAGRELTWEKAAESVEALYLEVVGAHRQ